MVLRSSYRLSLPGSRSLTLGPRTLVMGVINVTPDSFANHGEHFDAGAAIEAAERMVSDGADLIDVGGESTRPGAPTVDGAEEWRRVAPVLEGLRRRVRVPLSIDTYKAGVARRALDAGADIVNDVSALTYDRELAGVVADAHAAVVLMHNRGRSSEMYAGAVYTDVMGEIVTELAARMTSAREAGIAEEAIVLDPGLGFAKRAEHTLAALADLPRLATLGRPILTGPSRKSFLKVALGDVPPAERVWGTAAAVTASVLFGAHIIRVHDVRAMAEVVKVADAIRQGQRAEDKGQR